MTEKARILAFAGSTRRASWNKKLIRLAAMAAESAGAEVTLVHVRAILANVGCIVLPEQVAVPSAGDAFGEDGRLRDESRNKQIMGLGVGPNTMILKIYP